MIPRDNRITAMLFICSKLWFKREKTLRLKQNSLNINDQINKLFPEMVV